MSILLQKKTRHTSHVLKKILESQRNAHPFLKDAIIRGCFAEVHTEHACSGIEHNQAGSLVREAVLCLCGFVK